MTPQQLPAYLDPPVTEVVVSLQFEPLPRLGVAQLGLLWQRFRSQYPTIEQHQPIAPAVERLGVRNVANQLQLALVGGVSVRLWFLNESGDQLVQVQNDRFIRNWRRVRNVQSAYPRFADHVLPKFLEDFQQFRHFLGEEDLGEPVINQIEVTYINDIEMSDSWHSHADLSRMFRGWTDAELFDSPVEAIHLRVAHQMKDEDGEFLGRLHVVLQSGFKSRIAGSADDKPVFVLTLTARGKPLGEGDEGMTGFIDLAHRTIVSSFDKMTTEEAHRVWRKKPVSSH